MNTNVYVVIEATGIHGVSDQILFLVYQFQINNR